MVNGILLLYKGRRVPFMAYRLLHTLLVEEGVFYNTKQQKRDFEAVTEAVAACAKITITSSAGATVKGVLESLNYENQVAIGDIYAGGHSILINGFQDGVYRAFDPDWDSVKDNLSEPGKYETYAPYMPGSDNSVNLRIWEDHLFAKRTGDGFQMGAPSMRFVTVLTKP